jgi:hypothetical protein
MSNNKYLKEEGRGDNKERVEQKIEKITYISLISSYTAAG